MPAEGEEVEVVNPYAFGIRVFYLTLMAVYPFQETQEKEG
jgi:hypothetical protein